MLCAPVLAVRCQMLWEGVHFPSSACPQSLLCPGRTCPSQEARLLPLGFALEVRLLLESLECKIPGALSSH